MDHVECSACGHEVVARQPNRGFASLIAIFWAASLFLGVAFFSGWGFLVLAAWATLAATISVVARRTTSWTCAECGSSVAPPLLAHA